jgi:molybdopterin-guanine dinucleotide biosynthesis protein MobB
MKIIHVAGTSGTGKTRFIRELLPALQALGPTGVVKHIGHHSAALEPGKDTTLFFEGGAAISAGIDQEKTFLITRENDLSRILALLSDSGMQFAVVEGFKQKSFRKIVFGSLPGAEQVLMIEPSVSEVISRLHEFSDFFTAGGLAGELRSSCKPGESTLVCTFSPAMKKTITPAELRKVRSRVPGASDIRICAGGENEIYIGISAKDLATAVEAARLTAALIGDEACQA